MQTKFRSKTMTNNDRQQSVRPDNLPICHFVSSRVLGSCLLLATSLFIATPSVAEEQKYVVSSGDTLIRIVRKQYPEIKDRQSQRIIMNEVVKLNDNGFINNDINGIRLGSTLVLPGIDAIDGLKKPAPKDVVEEEVVEEKKPAIDQDQASEASSEATQASPAEEPVKEETTPEQTPQSSSSESKGSDDATLTAQLTALTDEKKALESTLSETQSKVKQLSTELEAIRSSDTRQASEALSTSETKVADLSKKVDELEAQNEALTEKLDTVEEKYSSLKSEKDQQDSSLINVENAKTGAESQLQSLTESLNQERAKNKRIQEEIKQYEADIEILNAKLADLEKTSGNAEESATAAKATTDQVEALTAQVEQLTSLAEKYETENSDLKQQISKQSTPDGANETAISGSGSGDIEALQAQVEQITALAEKYESELDALKAQGVSAGESQVAEPAAVDPDVLSNLQSDNEKKEQRITELERQVQDFTGANADLSRQIEVLKESSGSGTGWLAWLLPIFALLGGSYWLSSRLRKRADEEAAEELRSVMSSAEAAVEESLPASNGAVEQENDDFEADIKLDIAKAYFELNNQDAAHNILQEVLREGSTEQRTKAEKLLENIQ